MPQVARRMCLAWGAVERTGRVPPPPHGMGKQLPRLPCSYSAHHPPTRQVEEEDVARARNQLKASILFSQDGTTGELH